MENRNRQKCSHLSTVQRLIDRKKQNNTFSRKYRETS